MGPWLSTYVRQASYLQLYWILQTGHVTLLTIHRLLTHRRPPVTAAVDPAERSLGWLEFRKRTTQCYMIGCIWSLYIFWRVARAYCYDVLPSERFTHLYEFLTDSPQESTVDVWCTYVGLTLFTVHVTRRLYECLKVSIFSRHRTVGPFNFLSDLFFYVAVGLSLIAESPVLTQQTDCLGSWSSWHWYQIPAVIGCVWAARVQSDSFSRLQKLRRNKAGHIVTTGYKVPRGGWFDTLGLTSPHYLAELVVYGSIGVALGLRNRTWWLLTGYMAANHVHLAIDKVDFYREKFKDDFPQGRRIMLPYLL